MALATRFGHRRLWTQRLPVVAIPGAPHGATHKRVKHTNALRVTTRNACRICLVAPRGATQIIAELTTAHRATILYAPAWRPAPHQQSKGAHRGAQRRPARPTAARTATIRDARRLSRAAPHGAQMRTAGLTTAPRATIQSASEAQSPPRPVAPTGARERRAPISRASHAAPTCAPTRRALQPATCAPAHNGAASTPATMPSASSAATRRDASRHRRHRIRRHLRARPARHRPVSPPRQVVRPWHHAPRRRTRSRLRRCHCHRHLRRRHGVSSGGVPRLTKCARSRGAAEKRRMGAIGASDGRFGCVGP